MLKFRLGANKVLTEHLLKKVMVDQHSSVKEKNGKI